jgi:hypothetical protein
LAAVLWLKALSTAWIEWPYHGSLWTITIVWAIRVMWTGGIVWFWVKLVPHLKSNLNGILNYEHDKLRSAVE